MLVRIGLVAYRISLPANTRAHNVFHVSLLNKYVHDLEPCDNLGCDSGGTQGRFPNRAITHPQQEVHSALESIRWIGEGAVGALQS